MENERSQVSEDSVHAEPKQTKTPRAEMTDEPLVSPQTDLKTQSQKEEKEDAEGMLIKQAPSIKGSDTPPHPRVPIDRLVEMSTEGRAHEIKSLNTMLRISGICNVIFILFIIMSVFAGKTPEAPVDRVVTRVQRSDDFDDFLFDDDLSGHDAPTDNEGEENAEIDEDAVIEQVWSSLVPPPAPPPPPPESNTIIKSSKAGVQKGSLSNTPKTNKHRQQQQRTERLNDVLDSAESVWPTSERLEFVRDPKALLRGFLRVRALCETIQTDVFEWLVMPQTRDERYENALYLATLSPFSPYYCVNYPLKLWAVGETGAAKLRRRCSSSGKDGDFNTPEGLLCQWASITRGVKANALTAKVSSSTSFASYPDIFGPLALGYQRTHFLARSIEHYEQQQQQQVHEKDVVNDRGLRFVPYALWQQLRDALWEEMEAYDAPTTDACVCGPHLGVARNIVLYVSSARKRSTFFVEPTILPSSAASGLDFSSVLSDLRLTSASAGDNKQTLRLTPQKRHLLPWVKSLSEATYAQFGVLGDYLRANAALVDYIFDNVTISTYAAVVTVDSFAIKLDDDDWTLATSRALSVSEGYEAICLQFCRDMAYQFTKIAHGDRVPPRGPSNRTKYPDPWPLMSDYSLFSDFDSGHAEPRRAGKNAGGAPSSHLTPEPAPFFSSARRRPQQQSK